MPVNRDHVRALYRRLWGKGPVHVLRTTAALGPAYPQEWQAYRPESEDTPLVSAPTLPELLGRLRAAAGIREPGAADAVAGPVPGHDTP